MSLTIADHETHVWLAAADAGEELLARLTAMLDDDERRRAASFRFDADRRLSIVARASVRLLLSRYLSRPPHRLYFLRGPEGKPRLETGELEFNVSHSSGRVAIAVSRGEPVGIDLEKGRTMPDLLDIAGRYFAKGEAEIVRAAAEEERVAHFFAFWTAKEAVIKAVGGGLSLDLTSFETRPSPGRTTPVQNLGSDPRLDGWEVFAFPRGDVHVALASRRTNMPTIRTLDLSAGK